MAVTNFSPLLGLALPTTGDLSGTWGTTVNDSITGLIDSAVAGTTNISTDANVTLTTTNGAANQARNMVLLFSGARTAIRTITAPAQSKVYTVINATTGGFAVTLVGAGPTTGLTIPNGASAVVAWNGSDFVEVGAGSIGNLVVNGTLTVTGATTLQSTLAVTGNITNTAGTANGVAYLNGSKVVTSGSALTFDGSNGRLGIATTTPTSLLSVGTLGSSSNPAIQIGSATNSSGSLYFGDGTGADTYRGYVEYAHVSDALLFGASSTEGMRLTSTGLGIGTSSVGEKLTVAGGCVQVTGNLSSLNRPSSAIMDFFSGQTRFFSIGADSATSGGFSFRTSTTTTNTERMVIDSSGNFGLGVTPSAWTTLTGLQVKNASISCVNNETHLSGNAFYSTTSWKYITNGFAARYSQNDVAGGAHGWFTAPTGTAGNAITFTQAMTLDASGNLAIGTTSYRTATGYTAFALNGTTGSLIDLYASGTRRGGLYSTAAEVGLYANTATPLTFGTNDTERARIDSSGNVGINTTTMTQRLNVEGSIGTRNGGHLLSTASNTNAGGLYLDSSGSKSISLRADPDNDASGTFIAFATDGTERARIDSSGLLIVSGTSQINAGKVSVYFESGTTSGIAIKPSNNDTGATPMQFNSFGNTNVGSITTTASACAFNNLSDYRVKQNIRPLVNALEKVSRLKPCTYTFILDNSNGEGFIAHELAEVCPQAVTGTKDAVDENGSPKYQGVDTSFLVATLTAAIQEQQAIIESLKARLDAANL